MKEKAPLNNIGKKREIIKGISNKISSLAKRYTLLILTTIGANELAGQVDNTRPQDSIQYEMIHAIGTQSFDNNTTATERNQRFYHEDQFSQNANKIHKDIDHVLCKTTYHLEPSLVENGTIVADYNNLKNFINTNNDTINYPKIDANVYYPWGTDQAGIAASIQPNGRRFAVVNGTIIDTTSQMYLRKHEVSHTQGVNHVDGLPNTSTPVFLEEIISNTNSGMSVTENITPTVIADGGYASGNGRTYMTVSAAKNTGLVANGGTDTLVRYLEGTPLMIETPAAQLSNSGLPAYTADKIAQFLLVDHPECLHTEYVAPPLTVILSINPATGEVYVANQADFNNTYINVIGTSLGTDEVYTCYIYDIVNSTNPVGNFALNDTVNISDFGLTSGVDSVNAKMSSFYSNGISTTASNNISTEIDTIAPTVPTLSANGETESTINLEWDASSDNSGLLQYQVLQDGVQIASVMPVVTNYTALGLSALTTYDFQIIAVDNSPNNNEAQSQVISATTLPTFDNIAPTVSKSNGDTIVTELGPNGESGIEFTDFATASDASGIASTELSQNSFDCDDAGEIIQVDYNVTDESQNPGPNTTTGVQYIEVQENLAPNLVIKNELTFPVIIGKAPFAFNSPTANELLQEIIISNTDNCDANPIASIESPTELQMGENTIVIKSIDENGNYTTKTSLVTITEAVGINDIENLAGFNIYPNPTNGDINLMLEGQKIKSVKIISPLGKTISHNPEVNNSSILMDISYFAPGIYLVQIETENGEIGMRKIIKN